VIQGSGGRRSTEKGEAVVTDDEVRPDDVRLLLEERSILRLLHRYAHAMDMGRETEWVDTFTADAVFDVVEVVGGRRVHREEGRGDLAAYVAGYPKPPQFRKHVVTDPIIEINGDTATVEAYWLLLQRDDADGMPVLAAFGHYHDRLVKTDGGWRIAERVAEVQASTTPAGGGKSP
jgi:3-phenylpropionate/cinnamic acid dioxygenase small subunit